MPDCAIPFLDQLYRDHHGWLRSLLRRRLGCTETAADLAHDAFLRLLVRPRRFASHGEARAYLGRMAQGLCVDYWRRREVERAWQETLASRGDMVAPSEEHQAIILETLVELDAMLRDLPDNVARAFVMAQLHGLPYRTIAERLGVSERMVKKYIARAMAHCALIQAELELSRLP
ncbi:MAG: sigma-70 family RNA polymerase sigma factor [Gammaproteobacteria bacterium]|nr:sigma-70 family RNA polymerase sigma factor [Gammaproteobacteria bacterium]